ncbi:C3 and PZP-like alpha-2-macroglobulin domain-containing protein 8 [Planococcus citri]|uniref:C3 and PZP-like alpha-2-macroglobulin domain-containing protein 8 n=1 Tax=Planococcus citri TaxID=170843 RepID=UPI0031F89530
MNLIIFWLFGLASSVFSLDSCSKRMNILLPKVVVPGQSTTALVHFHSKDEQHNVTLRLIRSSGTPFNLVSSTDVLAQNTVVIKGNGIVWLQIPSQENGMYDIQALLDCTPSDQNCTMQTSSKVKLAGSVRDVIIRPSSNYYRPGETIVFWILSIDQTLRAPKSSLAKLYIKDSRGISQAFWEDIPLFQGTKEFKMPISERAPLGKWTIQVQTEGNVYYSELNVSLARGSNQPPNREQVVTEKHFVELHFSNEMRRKYKPGLPLMGKVEAVSSEEEVRVRVKVIDDQFTVLYSQDIDMNGREGTFFVPAVITNTEEITVQAELISLGGKDVDSQYVLAKETLHKWKSESNCYLLIKDLHTDLKPSIDAEVTVLTSCPCSGDMHYVVTTEGRMISWGELTLSNQTNVPINLDSIMQGVNIYEFNISFSIESEMAPISHLFVYYTTPSGEIVGDSISFRVKLLHEKVSLILDENNVWYIEDKIKVGILSFPKTHVCLVGGRSEDMHLPNREPLEPSQQILEDGMSFLNSCDNRTENEDFHLPKHVSYYPSTMINQVWLWKCFNYTEDIETNGVTLPPTNGPGKWKLWVFSVSDTAELRISEPVTVNVFSPVNIQFELPTTVKVMEIVQVEITISSNINSCIDIHALIALSEGAIYPGIDMSIVSEKLRLGGHGATSIVVRIQPVTPGLKTMTANVSCYVREGCEEAANSVEDFDVKIPITSVVTHSETLEAMPEGIQKIHTESAYFCANEEVLTLPSREIHYNFIPAPRKKYNIVFDIIAEKNFHIALAEQQNSSKNIYQIYLGDFDNTVSWIGRGKHNYQVHLTSAQTPYILSGAQYQTFWLSWENSVINIGKGSVVGSNPFLTHIIDRKMKINYIGFSSNWGVKGQVRISEHNDESGYSQVLRLEIPHRILSGSEKGYLYVTGGLCLPLVFQNMEIKSNVYPFSSLASTLSSFTPVLLMDSMAWDLDWLYSKFNKSYIHEAIEKNIQTLLTYMNDDYSFSDHPNVTDHLNTVRVFEILSRAQYYWKIDSQLIENIKKRIRGNQKDEGYFSDTNNASLEDKVAITAETLSAYVEVGFHEEDYDTILNSQRYIERNIHKINNSYVIAVACYALKLLKSDVAEELVDKLYALKRVDGNENDWQNTQSATVPSPFDWLYEKEEHISDEEKKQLISNYLANYKASAYEVLVHTLRKDPRRAEPVVKYIFYRSNILDQHPEVSYLVAKALVMFSRISRNIHPSLTISLATSGMELTDTLELKSEHAPHILDLPSLPTKVFIYATGAGCSTVQSQVTYSTYETTAAYSFDIISFIEAEIPAHYNVVGDPEGLYPQLILKSCFKLDNHSKGFRMEAILFSGYRLDSVLSVSPSDANFTYGSAGDKVWFMFANVPEKCGICVRYVIQSSFIISSLRPMFFRMYEIENPQIVQELFVHSLNKDSLLRTDVTDAHFTTWFGSSNGGRSNNYNDLSYFYQCDMLIQNKSDITIPTLKNNQETRNPTQISTTIEKSPKNSKSSSTANQPESTTSDDISGVEFTTNYAEDTSSSNEDKYTTYSTSIKTTNKTSIAIPNTTAINKIDNRGSINTITSKKDSNKSITDKSHDKKMKNDRNETKVSTKLPLSSTTKENLTQDERKLETKKNKRSNSEKALQKTNEFPKKYHKENDTTNDEVKKKHIIKKTTPKPKSQITIKPTKTHSTRNITISTTPTTRDTQNDTDFYLENVSENVSENVLQSSNSTLKPQNETIFRKKEINKIVVGQNELIFDLSYEVTTASPNASNHLQEKKTTTSALWGMLKEVAYDTKRKPLTPSK